VQGRWREVHFGDRARGAEIGPSEDGGGGRVSESGCEQQSAVWALGAPEPKKRVKAALGLGSGGKGAENGPPGPPFSATTTGTETIAVIPCLLGSRATSSYVLLERKELTRCDISRV